LEVEHRPPRVFKLAAFLQAAFKAAVCTARRVGDGFGMGQLTCLHFATFVPHAVQLMQELVSYPKNYQVDQSEEELLLLEDLLDFVGKPGDPRWGGAG